jgi:uncharacterized protein
VFTHDQDMVFVWGWGPRRRRGPGYGPGYGPGWGPGRGYGPPPPGYGYRGGGGGSCLRDLLFLETGCCLAELLGCGPGALLLAPATLRRVARTGTGGGLAARMVAAIRVYQREVSPRRPPCCRFSPTCSAYGVEAIRTHGAWRGGLLTLRRLLRCRSGAVGGPDPVPPPALPHARPH